MEAIDYRLKTNMYHVNMLKNYIAREPEVDVVHTSNKNDVTIVPDLEKGFEGVRDIKLGEDLSEDQRHTS